jgi:Protein of unknown function (DUF2786)/SprT-like family
MFDFTRDSSARNRARVLIWTDRLYTEYEDILYQYNLRLRKPVIRIEPLAAAWGNWNPETRSITLAHRLIERHPWDIVVEVLKHEMAHQLADERLGACESAHGETFRHACRLLGVADWAAGVTCDLPPEIPDWRQRVLTSEEERLLRRVEKLLALAESSNEHEAALAVERVRQLYAKYNLERLAAGSECAYVHCVINRRRRRIESDDSAIFGILTAHFMVRAVFTSLFDARDLCEYRVVELLGTRENVLMAEYVYHFLRHKLDALWDDYRSRTGVAAASKRSYMLGVVSGFRKKLDASAALTDIEVSSTASQALLRLADQQLETFVTTRYPRLTTRWWAAGCKDRDSYGAGVADGGNITLHRGITYRTGNRGLSLPAD